MVCEQSQFMAGCFVCALLYFTNPFQEREKERGEREKRGDRSLTDEGGKRGERRNESSQREKSGGRGRYDGTSGGEKGEKSESSGQGERGDGNCPPHDGCQDSTEATGWRGRRTESHEGEERASEEEEGGGRKLIIVNF